MVGRPAYAWLDVYQLPLDEHSVPIHTVLTSDTALPVLGSDHRMTFGRRIFGIAPVGNGASLWLSDSDNHRVLRIRDPLTNPLVDVILGQTGPDSVECNRGAVTDLDFDPPTADMLCFPGALSLDRQGNLYVSDHSLEHEGNFRLLVFLKDQFPTNNSTAIYAPPAYKVFDRHGLPGHNLGAGHTEFLAVIDKSGESGPLRASTFETAFDSQNTMVVGYNMYAGSRFVGVYDDPLGVEVGCQ